MLSSALEKQTTTCRLLDVCSFCTGGTLSSASFSWYGYGKPDILSMSPTIFSIAVGFFIFSFLKVCSAIHAMLHYIVFPVNYNFSVSFCNVLSDPMMSFLLLPTVAIFHSYSSVAFPFCSFKHRRCFIAPCLATC